MNTVSLLYLLIIVSSSHLSMCLCARLVLVSAFCPCGKGSFPLYRSVVPESCGLLSLARQAFTWSDPIRCCRDGGGWEEKRRRKILQNSCLFFCKSFKVTLRCVCNPQVCHGALGVWGTIMAIVWMKDIYVHITALWVGFNLTACQLQKKTPWW